MLKGKKVESIFVLRNDRFGELLLNIPVLRALREAFKNYKIILGVCAYNLELAKLIPFVDETIIWGQNKHSLREKAGLIKFLRKERVSIAVMLNPSWELNILTFISRIPIRVGYNRKCGVLLTHKIKDRKHFGDKHEIDYNLELAGLLGIKTDNRQLELRMRGNPENLIAVHPWTSDPVKNWPLKNFINLVKRIAEELKINIVLIGADRRQEEESIFDRIHPLVNNLIGKTSLVELAKILSRTKLLISGDSGPVHLAGCFNVPVIALFRNDLLGKNSVRWGPVSSASVVLEKNNLLDISVDEVFEKVRTAF